VNQNEFYNLTKKVRLLIINAIYSAKKGHLGGALSSADILTFLFLKGLVLPHPGGKQSVSRRPFIMSKAHSATALLAVLWQLFPESASPLTSYNKNGSLVGNNPSENVYGIELHAGSLGHGIGFGSGLAFTKIFEDSLDYVVVLCSDGEFHEGTNWEGLLFTKQHELNVCIIIDNNGQICEDRTDAVISLGNLNNKMQAFGFEVLEINGNNLSDLEKLEGYIKDKSNPRVVIANTIKGKGISFMEKQIRFHHSIPTADEYRLALIELGGLDE
jgi:transketolase